MSNNGGKETAGQRVVLTLRVRGDSMFPLIPDQSTIVFVEPSSLKIGDIVLAENSGLHHVVHRIYQQKDNLYVLKGDFNLRPDRLSVSREHIIGKAKWIIRKNQLIDVDARYFRLLSAVTLSLMWSLRCVPRMRRCQIQRSCG